MGDKDNEMIAKTRAKYETVIFMIKIWYPRKSALKKVRNVTGRRFSL